GLLRAALGDALQAPLGLAAFALGLFALAADLGQLPLGQPTLLLGLLLALAFGQVDLLLAALLLLLALGGLARQRLAAHLLLVDRRGLGHLDLRRGLRLDRRVLGQRHRDRLRLGHGVLHHDRVGLGRRLRLGRHGIGAALQGAPHFRRQRAGVD